ncbi:rhomboid family intramembrane serine protease [Roseibacillus persicicus]|uniref:rhomboid family intramembrane serine protease n=1 Tax=Roseibacillus persicicus TaxID=454148 RepID=UPI0016726263|nr:rhomboid family intramembrane serine protease [Roseibacillus persicicus]
MIFPLSDDDRHLIGPGKVTIALIVLNVLLFGWQSLNPEFTLGWSVIPKEIVTGQDLVEPQIVQGPQGAIEVPQAPGPALIYFTIFSAMFMHGGLGHIGGNMLYLWIFGDNVEHRFGPMKFLLFYLFSGIAATVAQVALGPDSVIPNLGASGAISGVMGAYLVLFPKNRVNSIFLFHMVSVPAVVVLGMWIAMQLFSGWGTVGQNSQTGGVAYAAHIGGFVAGVVAGLGARLMMKKEPENRSYEFYTIKG